MPLPPSKSLAISRISQEIWDVLAYKLPSVTAGYAARALRFKIRPQQQTHIDLWKSIFKSEAWLHKVTAQFGLNPALIGRDLEDCLNSSEKTLKYLILVAGDKSGNLRGEKHLLLSSLVPHEFNEETMEVWFFSGLTLNIANVCLDQAMTPVDLSRVFSYNSLKLQTLYLLWQDEGPKVRSLGIEGIAGLAWEIRRPKGPSKVNRVCGLTLVMPAGEQTQYLFEAHGLYNEVRKGAILPIEGAAAGTIKGWKWKTQPEHPL